MTAISLIGLGYIGLPTAILFAKSGFKVHGYDIKTEIITQTNQAIPHFSEPDLDILLQNVIQNGHFKAYSQIHPSEVYIIAVPTPIHENKTPDLSYVIDAIENISEHLKADDLIIIESTIPVGTCEKMAHLIYNLRPDLRPAGVFDTDINIHIAHCPERVLPGKIVHELIHNDRIIGGITPRCTQKAIQLYQSCIKGVCHGTEANIAETVKLTENAFRDVNIAFANELSMMCDHNKINVRDVIRFANKHPRVTILSPGPGVGGHCIAVDPWFLIASAPEHTPLMKTARAVNDSKPDHIVSKIKTHAQKLKNPIIHCLGLTYKANVDDTRHSPSIEIVKKLLDENIGELLLSDPFLKHLPSELDSLSTQFIDVKAGIKKADIIVLLTDHDVFKNIDPLLMMQKIIIDTRGLWG